MVFPWFSNGFATAPPVKLAPRSFTAAWPGADHPDAAAVQPAAEGRRGNCDGGEEKR